MNEWRRKGESNEWNFSAKKSNEKEKKGMRKKVCGKHMEYNNSIVNQAGQIGYNIE
jgi:hypothetical protein